MRKAGQIGFRGFVGSDDSEGDNAEIIVVVVDG